MTDRVNTGALLGVLVVADHEAHRGESCPTGEHAFVPGTVAPPGPGETIGVLGGRLERGHLFLFCQRCAAIREIRAPS